MSLRFYPFPMLLFGGLLLLALGTAAQTEGPVMDSPPELAPDGGGAWPGSQMHAECVPTELRTAIESQLELDYQYLSEQGKLPAIDERQSMMLQWPTRAHPDLGWNHYYGISNYVDQDPSGAVLDYICGLRTYNGHRGVDIFSWPFAWWLVENNLVEIVAAAPGVILSKFDGNSSYSCDWVSNPHWNAVYILHADGSVAFYGHLKEQSLTSKAIGEAVEAGEYLGIMASSGISTGPHLHFELYRHAPYTLANLVDPYAGSCNDMNNESWWEKQEPYRKPTLNTIMTHSLPMEFGCPTENEKGNFSNWFPAGATVYFARYYRDQMSGSVSLQRIRRPNGSLYQEWSHTSPSTYNSSFWWNSFTLPSSGPFGAWTFESTFQGTTLKHTFYYGVPYSCQALLSADTLHICEGAVVRLMASGTSGSAPYVYQWSDASLSGPGGTIAPVATATYQVTVSDHFGCTPGTASVTIEVSPRPDTSVMLLEGVLIASQSGAQWQWLSCDDQFETVPGATSSVFAPSQSGAYAVAIDLGGCVDTSACVEVIVSSLQHSSTDHALRIYPNPASEQVQIALPVSVASGRLLLYNALGQVVRNVPIGNTQTWMLELNGLPSGLYQLELSAEGQLWRHRLMKL